MSTFVYPAVSISTTGLATEAKQDDIIADKMFEDIQAIIKKYEDG